MGGSMSTLINTFSLLFGKNIELRIIIYITLMLSFFSTLISSIIGLFLGTFLGYKNFTGKKLVMRILHTLMSTPPVVAGLIVFLLLSRKGPVGNLGLLFSMPAMIIAQVIIITPIIIGMSATIVSVNAPKIIETTWGLGVTKRNEIWLIISENRFQFLSVVLMGFGRAISEVGAVQLVGGNIRNKTRTMTTAIVLETNKGNFELAIALGIILMTISFFVNSLGHKLKEKGDRD
jgi:tungstate transport system permease protein